MNLYYEMPWELRAIVCVYGMLIMTAIVYITLKNAVTVREKRICIPGTALFFVSALLLQGMADNEILILKIQERSCLARFTGNLSQRWMIIIWLLISVCTLVLYDQSTHKKKYSGTDTVKQSLDNLPDGVCFYTEEGTPVLTNISMNHLCGEILRTGITNGQEIWDCLKDERMSSENDDYSEPPFILIKLSDGSIWEFQRKIIYLQKKNLWEMTACDITRQYELNQKLKARNQKLNEINERLQIFNREVADIIREEEILDTRIRLHDEVGRSLLMFRTCLEQPLCDRDWKKTAFLWKYIVTGIRGGSFSHSGKSLALVMKEAESLNVSVVMDGQIPELGEADKILGQALRECINNAVKHAKAEKVYLKIRDKGTFYQGIFTNDGNLPDKEIQEAGGLKNLRNTVEKAGGRMEIISQPRFVLIIEVLKGEKNEI